MSEQPWLERIFDKSGATYVVDKRSPEEAAAHVEREQEEKAAELAQLETSTAYFDEDGVCRMVAEGSAAVDGFAHSRPVAWGTRPNDITINLATGRVNKSKAPTLKIPEAVPLGEPLVIALPDGVVAEVNGERHRGSLTIDAGTAGRKLRVELHGRERGTFDIEVRGYAEERRAEYPPIADQLDMIVNLGVEGYRAEMQKVKAKFPKPAPATKPKP
jgi:hypothetical protein